MNKFEHVWGGGVMVRTKLNKLEHVHWVGAMAKAVGPCVVRGAQIGLDGGGCLHMTCD